MAHGIQVVFDTKDPEALSRFYAKALGYKLQDPPVGFSSWEEALKAWKVPESEWNSASAIVDPDGKGPRIYFQRMDTQKIVKNRVHIDINASGGSKVAIEQRRERVRAEAARIKLLGASVQREWEEDGDFWVVMLDPDGNEFCVQ